MSNSATVTTIFYSCIGPSSYYNSYFGDGDYPMVYSYVNCNGWEKNFVDCPKDEYPNFTYEQYCTRSDAIGLRCYEG